MAISVSKLSKKRLGDWVINPYIGCEHGCKHCYCPQMPGVKFFNGGRPQRDWGEYLIPKQNWLRNLRRDVRGHPKMGSIAGQGYILASFLTDCYTPAEATHRLTRESLRILLEAGCQVRIQTRSALVEQDFDLLKDHQDRVLLGTSLPYLDDQLARVLEPHAAPPSRRLRMLENAKAAGLAVYVAIAPFMPFHGDAELDAVVGAVRGLSPVEIFDEVLNPRGENLAMMRGALREAGRPEAIPDDYRKQWPRFTYGHLQSAHATCAEAGVDDRFIAWPDPVAAKAKALTEDERAWLSAWLPSKAEMALPRANDPRILPKEERISPIQRGDTVSVNGETGVVVDILRRTWINMFGIPRDTGWMYKIRFQSQIDAGISDGIAWKHASDLDEA